MMTSRHIIELFSWMFMETVTDNSSMMCRVYKVDYHMQIKSDENDRVRYFSQVVSDQ